MLETRDLHKSFEGFRAITAVDFTLEEGTRHAIIGPNGAGKTTFFNLITGHLRPTAGQVLYRERDITGQPPHRIVKLGIARSFQRINIYPRMTVFQNVQVALIARDNNHFRFFKPAVGFNRDEAWELLELVGLTDEAQEVAGELAYGRQKQLDASKNLADLSLI